MPFLMNVPKLDIKASPPPSPRPCPVPYRRFSRAIYPIHSSVLTQSQSTHPPHPQPLPPWCPHICSLCVCLYFCQQAFIYCVTWLIQEVEDSVEIQFIISLRVHHIETVVDTWLRRFMGLLEIQEKNRCE